MSRVSSFGLAIRKLCDPAPSSAGSCRVSLSLMLLEMCEPPLHNKLMSTRCRLPLMKKKLLHAFLGDGQRSCNTLLDITLIKQAARGQMIFLCSLRAAQKHLRADPLCKASVFKEFTGQSCSSLLHTLDTQQAPACCFAARQHARVPQGIHCGFLPPLPPDYVSHNLLAGWHFAGPG